MKRRRAPGRPSARSSGRCSCQRDERAGAEQRRRRGTGGGRRGRVRRGRFARRRACASTAAPSTAPSAPCQTSARVAARGRSAPRVDQARPVPSTSATQPSAASPRQAPGGRARSRGQHPAQLHDHDGRQRGAADRVRRRTPTRHPAEPANQVARPVARPASDEQGEAPVGSPRRHGEAESTAPERPAPPSPPTGWRRRRPAGRRDQEPAATISFRAGNSTGEGSAGLVMTMAKSTCCAGSRNMKAR